MKNFFLGLVSAVLVPVLILIGLLLVMPDFRHMAFRAAVEVPGVGFKFMLRRQLLGRNFSSANTWLNRHLDFVENFAPGRTMLLPALVENAEFTFERARRDRDIKEIQPFLKRFAAFVPTVFPAQVWVARSLMREDPKAALAHLEKAAKLISADDRPYRLALTISKDQNWPEVRQDWCQRYFRAQFGGHKSHDFATNFGGHGLQRLALEASGGDEYEFIVHHNLQLNETNDYEFVMTNPFKPEQLKVFANVVPGILMKVQRLRIFNDGRLVQNFDGDDLSLTSRTGFHLPNGSILGTARDGEVVTIHAGPEVLKTADRIVLTMAFERGGLITNAECRNPESP